MVVVSQRRFIPLWRTTAAGFSPVNTQPSPRFGCSTCFRHIRL